MEWERCEGDQRVWRRRQSGQRDDRADRDEDTAAGEPSEDGGGSNLSALCEWGGKDLRTNLQF